MSDINIKLSRETDDSWQFSVSVSNNQSISNHTVSLSKSYWQKITIGSITPEKLVHRSFEFLLERESKESILSKFDLSVISTYFPEFEKVITKHS